MNVYKKNTYTRFKYYITSNGTIKILLYNLMFPYQESVWNVLDNKHNRFRDKKIKQIIWEIEYYTGIGATYEEIKDIIYSNLDICIDREWTKNIIKNKNSTTRMAKKIKDNDFWNDYLKLELRVNGYYAETLENVYNRIEKNKKENKRISNLKKKNTFFEYANSNKWNYFITLTYADKSIQYNKNDIQDMKKRLKRDNIDISYLGVIEEHKKGGIHLHLLANIKGKIGVSGIENGKELEYHYKNTNEEFAKKYWLQGFVRLDPIKQVSDKVVNYMSKYLTKQSLDNHRILKTRDLKKAEVLKGSIYCEMWQLNNIKVDYKKKSKRALVINIDNNNKVAKQEMLKLLTGEVI